MPEPQYAVNKETGEVMKNDGAGWAKVKSARNQDGRVLINEGQGWSDIPAPTQPKTGVIPGTVTDNNPIGVTYEEERGAARSRAVADSAPKGNFNERLVQGIKDYAGDAAESFTPGNMADILASEISGINNLAYFGMDDEIAGAIGDKTGFKPLQDYEATQDRLREEKPAAFMGGSMAAGALPVGQVMQGTSIVGNALRGGAVNAGIALPWGYNDADQEKTHLGKVKAGAVASGVAGLFGATLGGGATGLSKALTPAESKVVVAELQALADKPLRPQSLKAFRRLLVNSGMSDSDILALQRAVGDRLDSVEAGPAGAEARKRLFQHYIEVLAEDPKSPLYNPQAAANILMTVQERANSALPKDGSRGIVGAAVESDRASQIPFLEQSAGDIADGTRGGTRAQVAQVRKDLGARYDAALDGQIAPQAQQQALQTIQGIRPLLDGPSGLKVQAAAEGVDLDTLIQQNPMKALHWIGVAARRKAQSGDPNRAAFGALRGRILPIIEDAVPEYRNIRQAYGTNEGLDDAVTFGDRLFGGAQSNMMNNPGMRGEMVEQFNALTPTEKQIALASIRDQALSKLQGSQEGAPARVSQLNTVAALDFLEQVGQKQFADDIRAIARENQLLSVADAGNPLRQSATFSNAQAASSAPPLYEGTIANAVNNSTPGTLFGEGMLMAFAPHYQGAYAAYRGSRLAAKAGFGTRKKTLEDMTRLLMSRRQPAPAQAENALARLGQDVTPSATPPQNAPAKPPAQAGFIPPALVEPAGGAVVGGAGGAFMDADGDGQIFDPDDMRTGAILGAMAGGTARLARQGARAGRTMAEDTGRLARPATEGAVTARVAKVDARQAQRAQEMGFDTGTTVYHGTGRDFDAFSLEAGTNQLGGREGAARGAIFMATNPKVANAYAQRSARRTSGQAIQSDALDSAEDAARSSRAREENSLNPFGRKAREKQAFSDELDFKEARREQAYEGQQIIPAYTRMKNPEVITNMRSFDKEAIGKAIDRAKAEGRDGLIIKNIYDDWGGDVTDYHVVFDPKNIRSVNAKFDPSRSDSPVLTAGVPGLDKLSEPVRRGLERIAPQNARQKLTFNRVPENPRSTRPIDRVDDIDAAADELVRANPEQAKRLVDRWTQKSEVAQNNRQREIGQRTRAIAVYKDELDDVAKWFSRSSRNKLEDSSVWHGLGLRLQNIPGMTRENAARVVAYHQDQLSRGVRLRKMPPNMMNERGILGPVGTRLPGDSPRVERALIEAWERNGQKALNDWTLSNQRYRYEGQQFWNNMMGDGPSSARMMRQSEKKPHDALAQLLTGGGIAAGGVGAYAYNAANQPQGESDMFRLLLEHAAARNSGIPQAPGLKPDYLK